MGIERTTFAIHEQCRTNETTEIARWLEAVRILCFSSGYCTDYVTSCKVLIQFASFRLVLKNKLKIKMFALVVTSSYKMPITFALCQRNSSINIIYKPRNPMSTFKHNLPTKFIECQIPRCQYNSSIKNITDLLCRYECTPCGPSLIFT